MSPPLATTKITERAYTNTLPSITAATAGSNPRPTRGAKHTTVICQARSGTREWAKGESVFRSKPNARLRHPPRANRTIATPCKPSCTNTPTSNAATNISSHITYRSSQGPKPHACACIQNEKSQ